MPIRHAQAARQLEETVGAFARGRLGWVVAALTLAICAATEAAARQPDPNLEGRVFQRSDGSLYTYKDGLKYRIQLADVSDDMVAALPEADWPVDRLDLLLALPASTTQNSPPAVIVLPAPTRVPGPYVAVASPNPGDTPLPGGYFMEGKAFDPVASPDQGTGIDRVQVFLEDRDRGGLLLANARLGAPNLAAAPGSQFAFAGWQAHVSLPTGVLTLFVYAHSSVTGKESVVRVPIRAAPTD